MNPLHDATVRPQLLTALGELAHARPLERKRLVVARYGVGRELLRALAASGVPWIGFELVTPRALAHELVADVLARERLTSSDEFDELALLDEAIDAVLGGGRGGLAELAESHGLRQAIAASVQALRQAGIGATAIERARFRDEDKRAQIARILDEYEARLRRPFVDAAGNSWAGRIDAAGVYRYALEALAVGSVQLPPALYALLPGQSRRGLVGALNMELLARGAILLPSDPVIGLPIPGGWLRGALDVADDATPLSWLHDVEACPVDADGVTLDLFAASSVTMELREVLRRVMAAGLQWDQVEIVATDPTVYGVALDGLARRLGIAVTYAVGLPVARTRPGRAVAKYLEWIETGFPADVLRQMLERGDVIASDDPAIRSSALPRLLRKLRIGRGRARYAEALARQAHILSLPQGASDERTAGEFAEDRARERAELEALDRVVRALLAATPHLPERDAQYAPVSVAALARGVHALLDFVPAVTVADRTAHGRMRERLLRLVQTAVRPTTLRSATAILLAKLDERVPAPDASGTAPWTSAGGHLHLADLEHGGYTGRRATFVVGLDAGRFPGGGGNDALLVDDDRRRLTATQAIGGLPTAAERIDERRYALAALLARLRGAVTLSYAGWDAVEGRANTPASELLQAFRLLSGNANADYEALHEFTSPAASPVPRRGALLDAEDVWLDTLAHEGGLRYGVPLVVALNPDLAAGVRGYRARRAEPSAHHGLVQIRPGFEVRDDPARVVSPTQLQTLGSCPLRYLLRYVLKARAPDDPELATDAWLSPLDRGRLMHAIYERALTIGREEALAVTSAAFEERVVAIAEAQLEEMRSELPPPGQAIYDLERVGVLEDARAFVAMVREDGGDFVALEQKFGRDGFDPVPVTLPDGHVLHLAGAIDRLDRTADGKLVVIDYKTGSRTRFGGKHGAFDGGRRLQHVLYAAVAEALHGAPVERAEYHFPTRKSENHRAKFERDELREGLAVVIDLLELASRGWFVPTTDREDCRICDYRAGCRVRLDDYGNVRSDIAEWATSAECEGLDVLKRLRR